MRADNADWCQQLDNLQAAAVAGFNVLKREGAMPDETLHDEAETAIERLRKAIDDNPRAMIDPKNRTAKTAPQIIAWLEEMLERLAQRMRE